MPLLSTTPMLEAAKKKNTELSHSMYIPLIVFTGYSKRQLN